MWADPVEAKRRLGVLPEGIRMWALATMAGIAIAGDQLDRRGPELIAAVTPWR